MDLHDEESLDIKNKKRRERLQKKKRNGCLISGFVALFVCVVFVGGLIMSFMPNQTVNPFFKYINSNPEKITIIYKDQLVVGDVNAHSISDSLFIDTQLLKEKQIDPYIFWDNYDGILTITTPKRVIRFSKDIKGFTVNGKQNNGESIFVSGTSAYLPTSFLERFYLLEFFWNKEENVVTVIPKFEERKSVTVINETSNLRYEPNIKSEVAWQAPKDEKLFVFDESEDFYKVTSMNGVIGYIKKSDVSDITVVPPEKRDLEDIPNPSSPNNSRVSLVWDQNATSKTKWIESNIKGINTVSPTWFKLNDETGELIDNASKAYVDKAHKSGYKVWALLSNNLEANMTQRHSMTKGMMRSTNNRQNFINNVLSVCDKYKLDGINIDFEEFNYAEDGEYFNQLIKELSPILHEKNLMVSVDVNVPTDYTSAIDRHEISRFVDYVIIMAYDEHWGAGSGAGSVASIGWVTKGVVETLAMVPQEKTILAVPLYTRIWKETETSEGLKVSQNALSMQGAYNQFQENKAEITWDSKTQQPYGEYVTNEDGKTITYKCWFENSDTIKEKVSLVTENNLAGVAAWKKGLETPDVWEIINNVIVK